MSDATQESPPRLRRFVAFAVDSVLVAALAVAFIHLFGIPVRSPWNHLHQSDTAKYWILDGVWLVALTLYYCPITVATGGSTVGKMMCELRVLERSGDGMGVRMAFVREVLVKGLLLIGLPLVTVVLAPLDAASIVISPSGRALHDRLVRTTVVRT
jgi:uncharacterized RDD family membrane protein YckC